MPVTAEKSAPYATSATILDLIERHRNRGLPSPVSVEVLARAGVSDSLIPRTLQALHTLDLIDENGKPSAALEGIRLAPEAEYKQRLSEWLKSAYADVLTYVDPSLDDETAIRDAFRSYQPVGQQPRMVTLFLSLLNAAGMMPEKEIPDGSIKRPSRRIISTPKTRVKSNNTPKFAGGGGSASIKPPAGVPAAIAGLLASLPPEGSNWTKEKRDLFMITFGAVVDFCYPVGEAESAINSNHSDKEEDG